MDISSVAEKVFFLKKNKNKKKTADVNGEKIQTELRPRDSYSKRNIQLDQIVSVLVS